MILRDKSRATAVVIGDIRTWAVRLLAIEFTVGQILPGSDTPSTRAWPQASLRCLPPVQRVTSEANDRGWSTIVLMVRSSEFPFTSTAIFFDKSPLATAV